MIPTIETIAEQLALGEITVAQAVIWLHMHAAGSANELRDYFAAKAMAALIAKTPFQEFPQDYSPYKKTALGAFDYADAMIEARAKP